MQLRLVGAVLAVFLLATSVLFFRAAVSTPMYAARSGRACDNCHVTPNNWVNPELAERKCSLSCGTCHVDPAGGGMRNVSGRYYGQATLPMIATSPRPTADWDQGIFLLGRRDRATSYNHNLPMGPPDFEGSLAYLDSVRDGWAWGAPAGTRSKHAFFPGRYGGLRANPMLRVAMDLRLASLFAGNRLSFPMQVDLPVSFNPVTHFTLLVNTGFRGRSSGYSDTFDDNHTPYFREAFALLHQLPYQVYAKAGRFTPSFGLRLDDHTSSIRRQFELDGSLPETRVTGIELGAAPNYPAASVSWFKMASRARVPDAWDIFDVDDGWGAALNLSYRKRGWSLGTSAMVRRRPLGEGGDTATFGFYGALNPWHYDQRFPLTYQVEFDFGSFHRASGAKSDRIAFYHELDYLVFNGVNLLVAHDWAEPDREIVDDEWHRFQGGIQITPRPGVTFDARIRALLPGLGRGEDRDLFVQAHFWN